MSSKMISKIVHVVSIFTHKNWSVAESNRGVRSVGATDLINLIIKL